MAKDPEEEYGRTWVENLPGRVNGKKLNVISEIKGDDCSLHSPYGETTILSEGNKNVR
jgi:hypothetical protein